MTTANTVYRINISEATFVCFDLPPAGSDGFVCCGGRSYSLRTECPVTASPIKRQSPSQIWPGLRIAMAPAHTEVEMCWFQNGLYRRDLDGDQPQQPPRKDSSMDESQERQQATELLIAEVSRDFPGLVERIKYQSQAVFFRYEVLCYPPTPECIRRVGALAILCSWYGCTAIFASDRVVEVRLGKSLGL
jgi:hypothetical protein